MLDKVDRQLVALLQRDARTSVRGLAREVGMSAGAVGERLERMESRGVIRGYRVEVDPRALGFGLEVLIGLQVTQRRPLQETVTELLSVPEVVEVQIVTGRWDLFVVLRLRDQEHLRDTLLSDIWQIPDFQHSESMIVLDRYAHPDGAAPWTDPDDLDTDTRATASEPVEAPAPVER